MNKIPCPLQTSAQKFPNETVILTENEKFTYRELNNAVENIIEALEKENVDANTRVVINAPNSPEYITLLFALWRIGACPCLISTRLPNDVVNKQIADLKAKPISLKNISLNIEETSRIPSEISLHQEANIVFTSGSSSMPKAVVHTLANHYYNALGSNENIPLGPKDKWLLSLPLYHVGGLGIIFRTVLAGATMVVPQDVSDLAAVISQFEITHVSLVPTQLHRLLKQNVSLNSLKCLLVGGGPMRQTEKQAAQKRKWPIFVTYGLTEMASQVATSTQNDCRSPQIDSAKILKYREVKISDKGEILVKGETLFKGYFVNDSIDKTTDSEGWFATGDLGKLTADGKLKVIGRCDNMFISGGENIQPEEIEKFLYQIEGVTQAIVVPKQSVEFGFRPVAFVQTTDKSFDIERLRTHLAQHLPKYKIPDVFYPWPQNISSDTAKINRNAFKSIVERELKGNKLEVN